MQISLVTLAVATLAFVSAKECTNTTVSITISARQAVFDIPVPQTNLEVTDFILNATKQGSNFTNVALQGYGDTSGTYNISTQFCVPSQNNSTKPVVQVLTHGIGFDKTYWDLSFKGYNYSYIDVATDTYKYCTLSFDRLGVGNSSHGEPLNEIQSFIEVAAIYELTMMLRLGTFPGSQAKFDKVVHVGHSFGSAQSYALANLYPTVSDGLVLTGFSMNGSFVGSFFSGGNFQLANRNQPLRFGSSNGTDIQTLLSLYAEPLLDYVAPIDLTTLPAPQNLPDGYLVSSDAEANKYLFLKPSFYDPDVLTLAESTKQAVTLGELLTLGSIPIANNFAGPVMIITGDSDLPYCGGDCLATGDVSVPSIPSQASKNFPKVAPENFTAYIQPNTGHGINTHYNATAAYTVIQDFLMSKGLSSA